MVNEQQRELQPNKNDGQASLPASIDRTALKLKAQYFGWVAIPSTVLLEAMGGQWPGLGLGIGLGAAAAYFASEIHFAIGPGLRAAGQVVAYLNRNNSGRAKHRLLNKDWWLGQDMTPYAEQGDEDEEEEEPEQITEVSEISESDEPPVSPIPAQFRLGRNTLAAIKEVSEMRQVYFGQTAARPVVLHIDEMYHVLDVAKSGRGKSNRFRLAMMQVVGLADTYYLNPFAAPVKSVTDARKIEVWQPIYDRLANGRPVRESDEILQTLTGLVEEIKTRSDQEQLRDFSWREHPIFVFIDEVPEIYARCPEAVKLLDRIGRGGRQFGIFAWLATQSALVEDIGLSTASQAQFKTLLYGGGDKTSGRRVLGSVSAEQEKTLKSGGAGLTLMIADGVEDTDYVRAPLVTNEAMFAYFGLPPFQMKEWLAPVKSRQVEQPQSIYRQVSQVNTEIPIYSPVNPAVNGSVSGVEAHTQRGHLHLLETAVNASTEHEGPPPDSVNVNVNAETRDVIKRLHDQGIKHSVIAKAVRLDGRKYEIYKQVCREMGIEKEA